MTNNDILEKPKTKVKIIAWVTEGKTDNEIAGLIPTRSGRRVTRQAIYAFRKRHAAEITPLVERISSEYLDAAVQARVHDFLHLLDELSDWIEEDKERAQQIEWLRNGKRTLTEIRHLLQHPEALVSLPKASQLARTSRGS